MPRSKRASLYPAWRRSPCNRAASRHERSWATWPAGRGRSFIIPTRGKWRRSAAAAPSPKLGRLRLGGFTAWVVWLFVHVYYLTGFKNRFFVVVQWALSYLTYRRGARLIVSKDWHISRPKPKDEEPQSRLDRVAVLKIHGTLIVVTATASPPTTSPRIYLKERARPAVLQPASLGLRRRHRPHRRRAAARHGRYAARRRRPVHRPRTV